MINAHALFSGKFENVCLPVQSNLRLIVRCLRFIFTLIAKLAIIQKSKGLCRRFETAVFPIFRSLFPKTRTPVQFKVIFRRSVIFRSTETLSFCGNLFLGKNSKQFGLAPHQEPCGFKCGFYFSVV